LDNSIEVFPANFDSESFSTQVFSARRVPDRRTFRWVICKACGQYRSDPVENLDLDSLYKDSTFDYSDESASLARTYFKLIQSGLQNVSGKSIIEIGGGNGFVLDYVLKKGCGNILGVEPSTRAIESASPEVKPFMITSMFKRGLIPAEAFDCAAMFHVMDHLPDPLDVLIGLGESLKPGGVIVVAVHDVNSWSARLLKSKSPIFDIEHTYLYSKITVTNLFTTAGFTNVRVRAYWNVYSLKYLVQLLPIPRGLKAQLLNSFIGRTLGSITIPVPLGNMVAIGFKKI